MDRVYIDDSVPPALILYLQALLEELNGTRYSEWNGSYGEYSTSDYEDLSQHRNSFERTREFLISQINTLCSQGIDFLRITSDYLSYMGSVFSADTNAPIVGNPLRFGDDGLYSTLDERISRTPTSNVVWQSGERGHGLCLSTKAEINALLSENGEIGIQYKNGIPDFTPVELARVVVDKITTSRPRNFAAANMKLCEELNLTREQVRLMRSSSQGNLTWHECNDRKTMQLLQKEIHDTFRHLGGVSELKKSLGGSV